MSGDVIQAGLRVEGDLLGHSSLLLLLLLAQALLHLLRNVPLPVQQACETPAAAGQPKLLQGSSALRSSGPAAPQQGSIGCSTAQDADGAQTGR